jgi:hypothetical protein
MKKDFVVFDEIGLELGSEGVFRQLGYPDAGAVSSAAAKKIEARISQAGSLIEPRGAYLNLSGVHRNGFKLFSSADGLVLALATIGGYLEGKSRELIESGSPADGVIIDAVGTFAAEQVADFVERRIREDFAGLGFKVSRRYAPGYCGWPVQAQKDVFSCFDDTLGISLTKGCLMIPEKSLSFVCLLSRSGDFSAVKVGNCRKCMQKNCPYRLQEYEGMAER